MLRPLLLSLILTVGCTTTSDLRLDVCREQQALLRYAARRGFREPVGTDAVRAQTFADDATWSAELVIETGDYAAVSSG